MFYSVAQSIGSKARVLLGGDLSIYLSGMEQIICRVAMATIGG